MNVISLVLELYGIMLIAGAQTIQDSLSKYLILFFGGVFFYSIGRWSNDAMLKQDIADHIQFGQKPRRKNK